MTMGWFSMFLMTLEKIQMFFQVDWEEYYSHYLVDLLGLDQVKKGNCWENVTIMIRNKAMLPKNGGLMQ